MFTMLYAFIVRSTMQPRRSRAQRILANSSLKNGHFVARIRILLLGDSLTPEQASRGGAIAISGAMTHRFSLRVLATLRNYLRNERSCESATPVGVIPVVRSIEHPVGGQAISE